jgi:hypothetical protein
MGSVGQRVQVRPKCRVRRRQLVVTACRRSMRLPGQRVRKGPAMCGAILHQPRRRPKSSAEQPASRRRASPGSGPTTPSKRCWPTTGRRRVRPPSSPGAPRGVGKVAIGCTEQEPDRAYGASQHRDRGRFAEAKEPTLGLSTAHVVHVEIILLLCTEGNRQLQHRHARGGSQLRRSIRRRHLGDGRPYPS